MMQLTEPLIVQDIFASGLADVENLGDGNWRFTFYSQQRSSYDGASTDNVVVCRIVGSTSAALEAVRTIMLALGHRCCGAVRERLH